MSKTVALLLILIIVTATGATIAKPALSSAQELEENTWTTKASMPDGITIVRAAAVDGKIYAMTGSFVYEYDPSTDNWTSKRPMPTPRGLGFVIAACQNKIYVTGGDNGHINEVYDPSTDSWETKEPMPTSRRWAQANAVNDKIYVIDGETDNYSSIQTPVNEVYDPASDSWTTKQPPPISVAHYASAVVDGRIYVIYTDSNLVYDTENDTWDLRTSPPFTTYSSAAVATTGVMAPKRVYVVGGASVFPQITNLVNVYDPELDAWSSGAPMSVNRTGHEMVVVDDLLYVLGGGSGWQGEAPPIATWILTSTVEAYVPLGYGTIPPEPDPFPTALVIAASGASAILIGAVLLVYFKRRKR